MNPSWCGAIYLSVETYRKMSYQAASKGFSHKSPTSYGKGCNRFEHILSSRRMALKRAVRYHNMQVIDISLFLPTDFM